MRNDEDRFERFYERHRRAIAAYCIRRVGSVDAADAASQVFTIAWQRFDDVPTGERELPWLYGVARRVLSHQRRGAGRSRRLAVRVGALRAVPPPGPDAEAVAHANQQLVREAVWSLAEHDREALLLSAWEGLTHAEIAEVVGCSQSAVDKRVTRAKARLARRYETLAGRPRARNTTDRPPTRSPVRAPEGGGDT